MRQRAVVWGLLVSWGVMGCAPRPDSAQEELPARLLQPARQPPAPVTIPEAALPPREKPPDLPEPKDGDPKARAVVLGRAEAESAVERGPDGVLLLGNARVSADRAELRVPGLINQQEGIVEYLAVGPRGKTHESVLMLDVEGTHLMVGCLLLGLVPAPLSDQKDPGIRIVRKGGRADPAPPPKRDGALVELSVEWKDAQGKVVRHRAEELLWDRGAAAAMARTYWVFTGSEIFRGSFVAEHEQSYIGSWPDRSAIFNNPLPSKNPYRGSNFGYEANRQIAPAKGTPITFVVRPAKG